MAINIFDVINPSFFLVLSGKNKISNFLLLNEVSSFFNSQLKVERKKLIEHLSDAIKEMHIESVGDDDENDIEEYSQSYNVYTKRANVFLNCLEKRGWLDRDRNEELIDEDSRTDAFIQIYDALISLIREETNAKEQSTALLSLYKAIVNFDYRNATSSIESIEDANNELEKSLLSINSKIKRFVSEAMSNPNFTEKEILSKLTIDYQKQSFFISFHNLLTKNNPNKYSHAIIDKVYELQSFENMHYLVKDYCDTKKLDILNKDNEEIARKYIKNVLEKVRLQMENIEKSLGVISLRNYSYTSHSVDRIKFRLNNEKDIKQDINNILKTLKNTYLSDDFEYAFDFYSAKQIDNHSTFKARALAKIAPKSIPFDNVEDNSEAVEKAKELIFEKEKFSINSINEFVISNLGKSNKKLVSEFCFNSMEDFIKIMLIPVYSSNSSAIYFISEPINKYFNYQDFEIQNFEVILKEQK